MNQKLLQQILSYAFQRVAPVILKVTGETLIVTGQVFESIGVGMQERGVSLLEAKQHIERARAAREERYERIQRARFPIQGVGHAPS